MAANSILQIDSRLEVSKAHGRMEGVEYEE